jgi:hypothetical protein
MRGEASRGLPITPDAPHLMRCRTGKKRLGVSAERFLIDGLQAFTGKMTFSRESRKLAL